MKDHNLITYKSMSEALDGWVLKELIGYYVNYRKQESPSLEDMLDEDNFQLFGVATRFPRKLASQVDMRPVKRGVYEVLWGTDRIRVIVLSEIPRGKRNLIWHLFSGLPEMVRYAASHYEERAEDMSTIINKLFEKYNLEGLRTPYTMEDFHKEIAIEHLNTHNNAN